MTRVLVRAALAVLLAAACWTAGARAERRGARQHATWAQLPRGARLARQQSIRASWEASGRAHQPVRQS